MLPEKDFWESAKAKAGPKPFQSQNNKVSSGGVKRAMLLQHHHHHQLVDQQGSIPAAPTSEPSLLVAPTSEPSIPAECTSRLTRSYPTRLASPSPPDWLLGRSLSQLARYADLVADVLLHSEEHDAKGLGLVRPCLPSFTTTTEPKLTLSYNSMIQFDA